MTQRRPARLWLFGLLLLLSLNSSRAHDLMASHVVARLRPAGLEVQIRIAADSAWPLVQEISPGALFSSEDFDAVGRPLLLAFAKTMDQLTVDDKIVSPLQTDVKVVEDTFLFAFVYPVPARGTVRLQETYLAKMSPDYASHIQLFDEAGKLVESKSLAGSNRTFAIVLPIGKSAAPPASAAPHPATPEKPVAKP